MEQDTQDKTRLPPQPAFDELCQLAATALDQGEWEQSASALDRLLPVSTAEKRRIGHLRGRTHFLRGEWNAAIERLTQTWREHGPHVGLLSDLLACYYMAGQTYEWTALLPLLAAEYESAKAVLSLTSRFHTALVLGKFLEEQGNVSQALAFYDEAMSLPHLPPKEQMAGLTQIVRLKSYLGIKKDLATHYRNLASWQTAHGTKFLELEVEHGLMLAETALFGIAHGFERFSQLVNDERLGPGDLRFIAIDFLELVLHEGADPGPVLTACRHRLVELDMFEELVIRMAESSANFPSLKEILALSKQVSPAADLRILALVLRLNPAPGIGEEVRRRLLLLLQALDSDSAHLYRQKWQPIFDDGPDCRLDFNCRSKVVQASGGREVPLARKELLCQILTALAQQREVPLDELVKKIWQAEHSESYYHRVRIAVQRLNKDLAELTAMPVTIEVTKSYIRLKEALELHLVS